MGAPNVFRYYENKEEKKPDKKVSKTEEAFQETLGALGAIVVAFLILLGVLSLHSMLCYGRW